MASEDEVGELYGLAPAEFVAARDALAKRLKADGDAGAAKAVKALRRPTVAAWAVNQLRRRHPRQLDELLELGERLRRAQAKVLTGGGAGTLKELLAERRATVERVARLAVGELDSAGGGGAAQREGIVATLEAALADPSDAEAVSAGRLAKELPAPSGFGVGDWSAAALAGDDDEGVEHHEHDQRVEGHDHDDRAGRMGRIDRVDDRSGKARAASEQQRKRAQRDVDEKRGALRRATDDVDAAQREHEAAEDEVERLNGALVAAQERATKAAEWRRLAERRAGAAAEALEEAERVLRDVSREYRD